MNSEIIRFHEVLQKRVLVLDGAMGTLLHNPTAQCCDMLSITQPDDVKKAHIRYLEAGADIITTNTFNSNALLLAKHGLSECVADICTSAARCAQLAIEEFCTTHNIPPCYRPFIAGSMGPVCLSFMASETTARFQQHFKDAVDAYRQQAVSLITAGVNILLVETMVCCADVKAATEGIRLAMTDTNKEVAIMFSATLSHTGQLISGETIVDFVSAASAAHPVSIGLNCGYGAMHLAEYIRHVADLTTCYVSIHPNAGIPDETGVFNDSIDDFCRHIRPLVDNRIVNIVGGCCGTTPSYIHQIANLLK